MAGHILMGSITMNLKQPLWPFSKDGIKTATEGWLTGHARGQLESTP